MKSLLLAEKESITVKNNRLVIGKKEYMLSDLDFTDIFVDRMDGYVSYKALRMLANNGIMIHFEQYSGEIDYSLIKESHANGKVKLAQYEAFLHNRKDIAEAVIESKIRSQHDLLVALTNKYEVIPDCKLKSNGLAREPEYAAYYFSQLKIIFDRITPDLKFNSRNTGKEKHNRKARDPINAMLNYAYSILYAKTLKPINENGLLNDISFVHYLANKPTLTYDLVENIRWIADYSIIQALETGKVSWDDFAVSELNSIRLRPSAQSLVIGFLQSNLNRYVNTRYGNMQYETLHERNIKNFAHSLPDSKIIFEMPIDINVESKDVVDKLRNMTVEERKRLGIRKNTLWYIQQNIKAGKYPKIYRKTKDKVS